MCDMVKPYRLAMPTVIVQVLFLGCQLARGAVLAESGFNDASGIHSDPFLGSPFVADVTVNNQGDGEEGWSGPWRRLGAFDDRAHVVTDQHYEGDQSVTLWADRVLGTSIERSWTEIAPKVRVDTYVMVTPGGRMDGQLVRSCCGEIPSRTAATWLINDNGSISLYDATLNSYVPSPFSVVPYQWNKYSLIADTRTGNWEFALNDVVYRRARPLKFVNTTSYIDSINLKAIDTGVTYVDAVRVIAIEPTTGDVDGDGQLKENDINEITYAMATGLNDPGYDIDGNGVVDSSDRDVWVRSKRKTYFGDSNLDGEFNSSDMTVVFQAGLYEDSITRNASWATGDWNGDLDFTSADLIVAFADGGYEAGRRTAVAAVPEPCGGLYGLTGLVIGAVGYRGCRRTRVR